MSLLIKLHGWEQDRQGQELGDKGIWEVTEQGKAEGSDTPAYPPPPVLRANNRHPQNILIHQNLVNKGGQLIFIQVDKHLLCKN